MAVKRKTEIPESVRACLWFADPEQFDWDKGKGLVITQALNRGTWEAVQWIYKNYSEQDIRKVVSHPRRGLWFPQALRFWTLFFGLSLEPHEIPKAIIRLAP